MSEIPWYRCDHAGIGLPGCPTCDGRDDPHVWRGLLAAAGDHLRTALAEVDRLTAERDAAQDMLRRADKILAIETGRWDADDHEDIDEWAEDARPPHRSRPRAAGGMRCPSEHAWKMAHAAASEVSERLSRLFSPVAADVRAMWTEVCANAIDTTRAEATALRSRLAELEAEHAADLLAVAEAVRYADAQWLRGEPQTIYTCDGHRHPDGSRCHGLRDMTLLEAGDKLSATDDDLSAIIATTLTRRAAGEET